MRRKKSRGKRPALCYGKIRYRSRNDAKSALAPFKAAIAAGAIARLPIRTYRCEACRGGWHLTSLTLEEYETRVIEHRRARIVLSSTDSV